MVRYKVKAGREQENQRYVEAVFDELARTKPAGLRYATFKLKDGVSFVRVASIESAENPLQQSPAFKAFSVGVEERCVDAPVLVEMTEVGSYRLFGE
jgi:hypothetical protein